MTLDTGAILPRVQLFALKCSQGLLLSTTRPRCIWGDGLNAEFWK